ncbi:MAG: polyphosphate kinase 1 [Verrucomicrobiota bacterium]
MADPKPKLLNREVSWLEFNTRVLDEALDPATPVLERLKFLAISAANLDEFFMVRVGGLRQMLAEGRELTSPDGLSVAAQLTEVDQRLRQLVADQYACLLTQLEPALTAAGIERAQIDQLPPEQLDHLELVFKRDILPVITPVAVESPATIPQLPGLSVTLLVRLKPADDTPRKPRFALLRLPRGFQRFIALNDTHHYTYLLLEEVVAKFVERFFTGETVHECVAFRIARNADLTVREDLAGDLLSQMREVLDARKTSACVRLEVDERITKTSLAFLQAALKITTTETYLLPGPVDLSAYRAFLKLKGFDNLRDEPWPAQPSPAVPPGASMFDLIAKQDILLFHPYESFEPVTRFLDQAADDPDVLAIKQILYRTNENSRIVAALTRAATKGKHVTALVELKARFDEARNIEWARALEQTGAEVIYGLRHLKVHAKLCIVVRREPTGLRRYCHFATGNYNEVTAGLYTDVGLLTCDDDLAADATAFFNAITGYSQPLRYHKLAAAPHGLRPRLLDLIESEIERCRQGQPARIVAKLNALVHQDIIHALYRASQAGVKIELNIRGICCLCPGVPGLSENITVISVIDRYLEHSRLFYFHHGGESLVFLSSADWMPRNLDRRVELLVPVENPAARARIIEILETGLRDTVKARRLLPAGRYERVKPQPGAAIRSQEVFHHQARAAAQQARQDLYRVFEPQVPQA